MIVKPNETTAAIGARRRENAVRALDVLGLVLGAKSIGVSPDDLLSAEASSVLPLGQHLVLTKSARCVPAAAGENQVHTV